MAAHRKHIVGYWGDAWNRIKDGTAYEARKLISMFRDRLNLDTLAMIREDYHFYLNQVDAWALRRGQRRRSHRKIIQSLEVVCLLLFGDIAQEARHHLFVIDLALPASSGPLPTKAWPSPLLKKPQRG